MSAELRGTSLLCRVARGAESAFVLPIREGGIIQRKVNTNACLRTDAAGRG
jgi:hypothetical protein